MVELVNKLHSPTTQLMSTAWVRLAIRCLSRERTVHKWDDLQLKSIFPPKSSLQPLQRLSKSQHEEFLHIPSKRCCEKKTEHKFNSSALPLCVFVPQISPKERRGQFSGAVLSSLLVLWLAERPWMSAEEHWNLSFPINEKVVKGTLWTLL